MELIPADDRILSISVGASEAGEPLLVVTVEPAYDILQRELDRIRQEVIDEEA